MFFHNRYDQESVKALEQYLNDSACTVEVYDVFDYPPPELPEKIRIWRYPFIITKQFVVLQPDGFLVPVAAGNPFTVKLGCFTLDGDIVVEEGRFYVYVNGVLFNDSATAKVVDIAGNAQTAVLTFVFNVSGNAKLNLRVEAEGYMPFDEVFEIAVS